MVRSTLAALLMVSLISFSACGPAEEAQVTELRSEIIKVHDELMPRMTELYDLSLKCGGHIADMENDTVRVSVSTLDALKQQEQALDEAKEAMMVWMRDWNKNYGEVRTDLSTGVLLDSLRSEKGKILEVQRKMEESIRGSQDLLQSLNS